MRRWRTITQAPRATLAEKPKSYVPRAQAHGPVTAHQVRRIVLSDAGRNLPFYPGVSDIPDRRRASVDESSKTLVPARTSAPLHIHVLGGGVYIAPRLRVNDKIIDLLGGVGDFEY